MLIWKVSLNLKEPVTRLVCQDLVDSKAIGSGIPNRIFYPTSEYQQNGDAVGAVGTIDPFTSKIFWE
jgi:hypothetical protein